MKNIIFDFGNVLITFDERYIVSQFTSSKEEQNFLIEKVINSPEWMQYGIIDSGYLSNDEICNLINDRTNNKHKELVCEFMENYYKYMNIQEEIIDIINNLKKQGYKLYLLSNTNEFIYEKHIKKLENLFDGVVLSCKIHAIKPYNKIYEYLIDRYNLEKEESLFIDDKKDNIETAKLYGIKGRPVRPNDVEDIKSVLKEYGIGE